MNEPCRLGAVALLRDRLTVLAIRFEQERPGERAVALVAESDIAEIDIYRTADEEYSVRGEDGSVGLIVDRESAKKYLYEATPKGLEYLPDEGKTPKRTLPVVHVARIGNRMEGIHYILPEYQGGSWPSGN